MTIQTLPRTLVAGAIKVVRLPADLALAYIDRPFATSAGVAVDRVDAAVRGAAGTVLRDDQLRRDADRRREGAEERARALRLRTEAEKRTDLGEELAEEAERVTVIGQVKSPGRYEIKDRATVLDVLAMAGGLNDFANRGGIVILRHDATGARRIPFAYDQLTAKAGASGAKDSAAVNFCVKAGDVILIP